MIQVATINGAKYHGIDHEVGSVEVGKRADLVVLSEDPLADITNTRSIRYVVLNGFLYNGDDAARVWPDSAPAPVMYFK